MIPGSKVKKIEIFCGPNGAGKSTLAEVIKEKRGRLSLINADVIAQGLNASYDGITAIDSGRIMLKQISELISRDKSFAFETTLSGRSWHRLINRAKRSGYSVIIYYVTLHDVSLALARVSERVKLGGHFIPEETIKRRFERSHRMFYNVYRPMVDGWFVFDNSGEKTVCIAKGKPGKNEMILDKKLFAEFLRKSGA